MEREGSKVEGKEEEGGRERGKESEIEELRD